MNTINKLIYSISCLIKLFFLLKNPFSLIKPLFNKSSILKFNNGLIIKVLQPLDLIIVKETIFDDDYKISSLNNPELILDIGAGIGDFSIYVAKKYPKCKLFAFEPNPEQFKVLRENLKLNNIKNVKVLNLAISRKKDQTLYVPIYNVHASTLGLNKFKKRIIVKGKRLDDFVTKNIDLIKVDCEGAEVDILKSISKLKTVFVKEFVIEYHNSIVRDEDKKLTSLLNYWKYQTKKVKNKIITTTGYIFAKKS